MGEDAHSKGEPARECETRPNRRRIGLILALAVLLTLPGVFLAYYSRHFGFDTWIVVFGQSAILVAASLIGLVMVGCAHLGRTGHIIGSWLTGVLAGALAVCVILIYVGSTVSNSIWGDALDYPMVMTFAPYARRLLDFVPVAGEQRQVIVRALGLFVGMVVLLGAFVAYAVARLTSHLRAHVSAGGRRLPLMGALTGTATLALLTCAVLAVVTPPSLAGEPVAVFLRLVPSAPYSPFADRRVVAAVEDAAARRAYRAPTDFRPTNVVVIFSDALRADRMGLYGYERPTTPFLSRLFDEKKLFRVDMALSSCADSYCGIASTFSSRPWSEVSPGNFKLYELLHDIGYRTNFFLVGNHRTWRGLFDYYGKSVDEIHDYATLKMDHLGDERPVLEAFSQIPAWNGQPNFFYIFLMTTHFDGVKLPEFQKYNPSEVDLPHVKTFWNQFVGLQKLENGAKMQAGRLEGGAVEAMSNRYDNGVLQMDAAVERIFATLHAKGYLDDSLIVLLADHGDGLGEHGHLGHTRYLYQEDIRVPILFAGPGIERLRNAEFAGHADIAPTILDLLGLPIPAEWRGHSLTQPPGDRMSFHQTDRPDGSCYAVVDRSGTSLWKYMRCRGIAEGEALFDLVADPGERNNLVASGDTGRLESYRRALRREFGPVVTACFDDSCSSDASPPTH